MSAAESLVKRDPESDFQILTALRCLSRGLDRRLEQLAEALPPARPTATKVEAFKGEGGLFAMGLPLDHAAVVGRYQDVTEAAAYSDNRFSIFCPSFMRA